MTAADATGHEGHAGKRVAGVEELPRGRIVVMRDPKGHEFCLLASPAVAP